MLYSQTSHLVSKATQKTLWQRLSQVMSAGCQSTWFAFLFKSPSFSTHPPHRLAPVPPPNKSKCVHLPRQQFSLEVSLQLPLSRLNVSDKPGVPDSHLCLTWACGRSGGCSGLWVGNQVSLPFPLFLKIQFSECEFSDCLSFYKEKKASVAFQCPRTVVFFKAYFLLLFSAPGPVSIPGPEQGPAIANDLQLLASRAAL